MHSVIRRTIRRITRPGLALVLVVAQAMAAFGYPLVRPRTGSACGGGACGCQTTCGGVLDGCCCAPAQLTPPPPPLTTAPDDCGKCGRAPGACCCSKPVEPDPAACPKCRDRGKTRLACSDCAHAIFSSAADSTKRAAVEASDLLVTWIPAFQASKCRGESPQGLMAEVPAVPPVVPSPAVTLLVPAGFIATVDCHFTHLVLASLDPPPRCG